MASNIARWRTCTVFSSKSLEKSSLFTPSSLRVDSLGATGGGVELHTWVPSGKVELDHLDVGIREEGTIEFKEIA